MTRQFKDSGVEWIGEIPEGWGLSPLKRIIREKSLKNFKNGTFITDNILSVMKDRGVINYNDKGNVGNKVSEDITGYKLVSKGDLVVNKMNITIGSLGIAPEDGALSVVYLVYEAKHESHLQYVRYCMNTRHFQNKQRQIATGILEIRESVNKVLFDAQLMPLPPLPEQQAIANYLDAKTKSIDDKVENLKARVKLLAELKQALIYETVTGKNVVGPKKDSGVEWIGEIPEGWGVVRVEQLGDIVKTISKASISPILSLTMAGVIKKDIENFKGVNPASYDGYQEISKNDLVFKLIDLANISTSRVGLSPFDGKVSPVYIRLVPFLTTVPKYTFYMFSDWYYRNVFNYLGGNGVRSSLTASTLAKLGCVLPPLSEQQAIADYLDDKVSKIDHIIETANKQIELLGELRQALIYEIVTGKREVPAEYYSVA